VGSLSAALSDGLAQSGALLLGGDVAFTLPLREADNPERAFLAAHGTVSEIAVLPTMAHAGDGKSALIEAKAVDGAYPLVGTVKTDPDMTPSALFERNGDVFGAAADPSLLARLQLKVGDRIGIGKATLELRAALIGEPDKLGGGIGFGGCRRSFSTDQRSTAGTRVLSAAALSVALGAANQADGKLFF